MFLLNTKAVSISNYHEHDGQHVPREVSLILQHNRGPISTEGIWRHSDNKVKESKHRIRVQITENGASKDLAKYLATTCSHSGNLANSKPPARGQMRGPVLLLLSWRHDYVVIALAFDTSNVYIVWWNNPPSKKKKKVVTDPSGRPFNPAMQMKARGCSV